MSEKQETSADIIAEIGNSARLREALEHLLHGEYKDRCEVTNIAYAALTAPPRNCDVGTAEEQAERHMNFCHNHPKCTGCPCVGRVRYHKCELAWAQLPYERGGAK